MRIRDSIKIAVGGLRTNKSRSALTILGIVIGITAIMLIMSIGQGAEGLIIGEISGLGGESIVIRPGKEPEGPSDFADTLFADSLKTKDLELLKKKVNVPDLVDLSPFVIVSGAASYRGETFRPTTFGGSAEFLADVFDIYPEKGRLFDENDIRQKANVVVIGSKVKRELFGESDAVGEMIKIKGRNLRVVGVFPPKGQVSFMNFDDTVILPYTTAQTYLLGIDHFHEVMVRTTGPETVPRAVLDIEATLRRSHGITDPKKDDFFVVTQQGLVDQIKTIISTLTIFLSSVVAIALVVGGIGVMNVMLVSVSERTREIGLRKAVGATNGDILWQFLLEAVLLTLTGGIVGIALGGVLSYVASIGLRTFAELAWAFSFPISAAILGTTVSGFVGVIFGLYPARKASRKSPIEALRYE